MLTDLHINASNKAVKHRPEDLHIVSHGAAVEFFLRAIMGLIKKWNNIEFVMRGREKEDLRGLSADICTA